MSGSVAATRWVLAPGEAERAGVAAVGGKAHNLARLAATGVRVPRWVVIRTDAFERLVRRGNPSELSAGEDALWTELRDALHAARIASSRLAVRSSAASEDGATASFAGQFDTVLGVQADDPERLRDAVFTVWRSAFNEHALAYAQVGADGGAVRMAVVLQEMVEAEVAGVAFSADPVTGRRDTAVVSAVYGLGEGLVSGELDADTFHSVARGGAEDEVRATVAHKDRAVRSTADGSTGLVPVAEERRGAPALTDDEVRRIASAVRELERAFGAPQDVEWALAPADGSARALFVLQARPITTVGAPAPARPQASGERRIWDNSNIVESYAGVTTPLTFSFARAVYEDVYRQFCRVVGVEEALIDRHRHVFANMLGLVRGRVYYNLLNWYRTLALLPGFALNRAFMERMMGVREKLESPPDPPRAAGRGRDTLRVARMAWKLSAASRGLGRAVPAFHARVDAALAPLQREELAGWDPDALLALYRRLEDELLRHWQTPLVNDFFAMIWFGVLGRLVEKWLPEAPPTLVNDLLAGEGGIVSTEPARRVMGLAREVARAPAPGAAFAREPDDAALWREIESSPELAPLHREMRAYLDRFGDRCANELKLETVTLGESPEFLVQTVRAYLRAGMTDPDATREREREIRRAAEERVRRRLHGVRRRVFFGVLRRTRERVRDRENLRFERTRVFGVVRRIFVALGGQLADRGRLREPRDVFYLTVEEVFGTLDGTCATGDLRALAEMRRAEFDRYEREPAPPERFETVGPPSLALPAVAARPVTTDGSGPDTLRGMGCCPGVVRAPVRSVTDPRSAGELEGRILVAERTDPGWTLLFPPASGLLVQRGSLLSHSAIVAREMGLPCIVGIPELMAALRDGEVVEMDGTTGIVRRLEHGGEAHGA